MHVHYSIDVFSAFFITYGVYALSLRLFGNLTARFLEKLQNRRNYSIFGMFGKFRDKKSRIAKNRLEENKNVEEFKSSI
jgi:hypothetical protein